MNLQNRTRSLAGPPEYVGWINEEKSTLASRTGGPATNPVWLGKKRGPLWEGGGGLEEESCSGRCKRRAVGSLLNFSLRLGFFIGTRGDDNDTTYFTSRDDSRMECTKTVLCEVKLCTCRLLSLPESWWPSSSQFRGGPRATTRGRERTGPSVSPATSLLPKSPFTRLPRVPSPVFCFLLATEGEGVGRGRAGCSCSHIIFCLVLDSAQTC